MTHIRLSVAGLAVSICVGACASICLGACAATPINVKISDEWPAAPSAYDDAYNQWTRHAEDSAEWIQVIDAYATLESPDYRAAQTAEWVRRGKLSDIAAQEAAAREREDAAKVWQVELVVSTEKWEWNDFDRGKRTMWRIALVGDNGREVLPESVVEDKREHTALRTWFKGIDPFKTAYIIRFPKVAADGQPLVKEGAKLTLKLGSPMGGVEMSWGNELAASAK